MSEEKQQNLIAIQIDGREVLVAPGTNIVEAAEQAGIEIPHYCYHPKLSISGNCRMCLVEMGMPMRDRGSGEAILDTEGNQKIGWMPKPVIACATNAGPGMHIRTDSQLVKECREGVMEFFLLNHPLDCPICDQAGECRLQEFATDYGRGYSRYSEDKNVKPKRTRIGERIMLDDERCILCSRCIRFCKEIAKDDVLGFVDRGSFTTLTTYSGKNLDNNYSLNTVDICPVGALTCTDFRFKMRVWFLKETNSICTESSVGVNTTVSSREGKIYRITPRRNDGVNDTWMSDSGRELFKIVSSDDRVLGYTVDGKPVTADEAIQATADFIRSGRVAVVGSGQSSLEEQWLLNKVIDAFGGAPVSIVEKAGEGDGLLISCDRNPNVRGTLVSGLTDKLPEPELTGLSELIDNEEVQVIISMIEDLSEAGISKDQMKQVKVIYMTPLHNTTSEVATVVVPGLTVFEKTGTFINQQFRLQKFEQAIPGPVGVLTEIEFLSKVLGKLLDEPVPLATPQDVWQRLSHAQPILKNVHFDTIPERGVLIDGSDFDNFLFPEDSSLHFNPKSRSQNDGDAETS